VGLRLALTLNGITTAVITQPSPFKTCYVFNFAGPFLKKIITKRVRLHLEFHAGHDSDLLRELQEYDVSRKSMHEALGGDYTDDMFMAWLKRRKIVEKKQAQQVAAQLERER
jgi:hypothetical protein